MKDFWPHKFPLILGWDLSGVVEELGTDVSDSKSATRFYSLPDPTRNGAYADYIVVREPELALKPNSLHQSARRQCLWAALTAWQSLFETAQLQPGQRVLIHAGSGGVGHFAVQLAKWKGAYVFATASTKNQDLLRELGVDKAIDYTQQRFEDVARKIDIVLDTLGGETQERSWSVLKKGRRSRFVGPVAVGRESQRTRRPGCAPRRATERRATCGDRQDHRLGQAQAGDQSHSSPERSAPCPRALVNPATLTENRTAGEQPRRNLRRENGDVTMKTTRSSVLVPEVPGYTELQRGMHDPRKARPEGSQFPGTGWIAQLVHTACSVVAPHYDRTGSRRRRSGGALRAQHPEWIEADGKSPTCDYYESLFAALLVSHRAHARAHYDHLLNKTKTERLTITNSRRIREVSTDSAPAEIASI